MLGTVLSTLLGVAVGATSTLYTTPYSGKEVRQKIKQDGETLAESIHEVQSSVTKVKQALHQLNDVVKTTLPKMKEDIQDLQRQAHFQIQPRLQRVQQSIAQVQADLQYFKKEKDEVKVVLSPLYFTTAPQPFLYEQLQQTVLLNEMQEKNIKFF